MEKPNEASPLDRPYNPSEAERKRLADGAAEAGIDPGERDDTDFFEMIESRRPALQERLDKIKSNRQQSNAKDQT